MGLVEFVFGHHREVGPTGIEDNRQEQHMSGEADKIKGRAKQAAGDLTDNDDLKNEGDRDETAGKAKAKVDDVKDSVNDAIDSVKDKLS